MNIYDIAEKANVSIATVSRVLNNSPRVSEKTRSRVIKIMESEGYVPNAFARGLGLNTMRMVGVMCTDVTDMFYASAVGYIEGLLRNQGIDTVLCCTGNDLEEKKKNLAYLVNRRVDAVILIGSAFKEEKDNSHIKNAAKRIPIIIVNGNIELPNVYCVFCDERGAMRENVLRLYKSGCKKILYLYDVETQSGIEKLCGYHEACEQLGIARQDRIVLRTPKSVDAVASTVADLYRSGTVFNGVLASEDVLAAGVMQALNELEISLPVIGFNNSVIAQCTNPMLSSVDNMLPTMCETAVRLLSDIKENKNPPGKTVVSARLVERESFTGK